MYFFLLKSVFFLVLCELLNLSKPCSCGVQSPTYLNVSLQPDVLVEARTLACRRHQQR